MNLLMSVFITDKRLNPGDVARGLLPTPNRTDVLRYTLESLSVLPIKKAYLYIELDDNYKNHDLSYIHTLFDAEIHTKRLTHQSQWKAAIDKMPDDLIWYCGNDDHVFMDRDLTVIENIINSMIEDLCILNYSHFPEIMQMMREANCIIGTDNYSKQYLDNWTDATQIMSKKLLHIIWNNYDYGDKFLFRTDGLPCPHAYVYLPLREICRHFDGYGNWNENHLAAPGRCNPDFCPALSIPPGFFEKEIKLRFFFDDNLPGWVNINPLKQNFTYKDINGTDYKWIVKDIPLFWKNKIKEITINSNADIELMTQKRNEAFMELMKSRFYVHANTKHDGSRLNLPWESNLLNTAFTCFVR